MELYLWLLALVCVARGQDLLFPLDPNIVFPRERIPVTAAPVTSTSETLPTSTDASLPITEEITTAAEPLPQLEGELCGAFHDV